MRLEGEKITASITSFCAGGVVFERPPFAVKPVSAANTVFTLLQNNFARVVAENLAAVLGTPRVTLSSQAHGAEAAYRAANSVPRFESMPGDRPARSRHHRRARRARSRSEVAECRSKATRLTDTGRKNPST